MRWTRNLIKLLCPHPVRKTIRQKSRVLGYRVREVTKCTVCGKVLSIRYY